MLVVMRAGATTGAIDAVRDRAREAGLATDVLTGAGRAIVAVNGTGDPALLAALPGVEEVVPDGQAIAPQTRDLRIAQNRPLISPAILLEELPLPAAGARTINRTRDEVVRILNGEDDRLVVVVGPC